MYKRQSSLQLEADDAANQLTIDVLWAVSMIHPTFGEIYNQPIAHVVWASSLLELAFRNDFDYTTTKIVG